MMNQPGMPMGQMNMNYTGGKGEDLAKFMNNQAQNNIQSMAPYMNPMMQAQPYIETGQNQTGKSGGQDIGDSDDDSNSANDKNGGKGKRRSKNDVDGRDFKCKFCDKTYLSYPALYTHIKQKHSKGPDGELRNPPTSGRGRGRPRKNPYQRTDPKSEEYFNMAERKGGPTDVLNEFESVFESLLKGDKNYKSFSDYPLFEELRQFSSKAASPAPPSDKEKAGKDEEHKDTTQPLTCVSKWKRTYDKLEDKDRQEMKVDEIFAFYLYQISKKVNATFYRIVLTYVILFRECLNEIGWAKKMESEEIKIESNPDLKAKMENNQFCLVNNAEHAPEICNEFVTVFMENKRGQCEISKPDQIDLTINLCHWLFENQFTCSKLTMIS